MSSTEIVPRHSDEDPKPDLEFRESQPAVNSGMRKRAARAWAHAEMDSDKKELGELWNNSLKSSAPSATS